MDINMLNQMPTARALNVSQTTLVIRDTEAQLTYVGTMPCDAALPNHLAHGCPPIATCWPRVLYRIHTQADSLLNIAVLNMVPAGTYVAKHIYAHKICEMQWPPEV